jgi:D-psicose/D-tagatose/L-ribulose 3-epimerase
MGPYHSALGVFTGQPATQEEWQWAIEGIREVADYAESLDITLGLEYLNRFELYLTSCGDELIRFVDEVNHPHCKIMFDTFHANIEEKKLGTAIETIAPVLHHVHISENDRGTPGEGHVPWDEAYAALAKVKYNGWLTIEAFSRNDPDFANAINVWREYSKPWDIAEKGLTSIKSMCAKHGLNG